MKPVRYVVLSVRDDLPGDCYRVFSIERSKENAYHSGLDARTLGRSVSIIRVDGVEEMRALREQCS